MTGTPTETDLIFEDVSFFFTPGECAQLRDALACHGITAVFDDRRSALRRIFETVAIHIGDSLYRQLTADSLPREDLAVLKNVLLTVCRRVQDFFRQFPQDNPVPCLRFQRGIAHVIAPVPELSSDAQFDRYLLELRQLLATSEKRLQTVPRPVDFLAEPDPASGRLMLKANNRYRLAQKNKHMEKGS